MIHSAKMINELMDRNQGPFNDNVIKQLFKEIFKASTDLQKSENEKHLYVSRKLKPEDTIVKFDNGGIIGDGNKSFVFGPCSVESQEQVDAVAKDLQAREKNLFVVAHLNLVHHLMISKV